MSKANTILCSYTKETGWRLIAICANFDARIKVVQRLGRKLLSIPNRKEFRSGRFCNPADRALDYVTNGQYGKHKKPPVRDFPLVITHSDFSVFMSQYRQGWSQGLRLGLAFYHDYKLHEIEDQTRLHQIWMLDGPDALKAIKRFVRFTGDGDGVESFFQNANSVGIDSRSRVGRRAVVHESLRG